MMCVFWDYFKFNFIYTLSTTQYMIVILTHPDRTDREV